jgi:uncharacterized protein YjdB
VAVGQTLQLRANISPVDADNQALTWTSSEPLVASVDPNGLVTVHLAPATVDIIATTVEGGFTATCTLTTTAPTPPDPLFPFYLEQNTLTLNAGEEAQLRLAYPDEYTVTWRSYNENIAIVSSTGKVIARAEGTVYIIVEDPAKGLSDHCIVTVRPAIVLNPFELNIHAVTLDIEETVQLALTAPEQYTVAWRSLDENIATVSSSGTVIAVGAGTTTIVAEDLAKGKSDECTVTVREKQVVYTIRLNHTTLVMNEGDRTGVAATVSPATDEGLTWSSSDTEVADVTAEGTIIAIAGGNAVITAQLANGASATCNVIVRDVAISAEASAVEAYGATLTFPRISGTSYYLVHLYEVAGDQRTPVVSYRLNPSGVVVDTMGPQRAPANTIRLVLGDLRSATFHEADIDVVREIDGADEAVSVLQVSFTTLWGTGVERIDAIPAAVWYSNGALRLRNLEGYHCRITSVSGQVVSNHKAVSQEDTHPVSLQPGVYILAAQKENERLIFKFVVF